ncbi:MAG TPA: adenylate/guanylate cyclase domain-containing protein [Armatimonadota bacterium]|nr:adenylate/guanylate cyclase domain-containing protein [Armatimonadota bacterium]
MQPNKVNRHLSHRGRAFLWSLGIGLVAALVAIGAPYFIQPIRDQVSRADITAYDWLYNHRGAESQIPQVAIVEIDKNAITNLQDRNISYPFPRAVQGHLIRNLKRAGARIVGMDILFSDLKTGAALEQSDAEFARALRECGNVVLAADFSASSGGQVDQTASAQDFPAGPFREAALGYGPVDVPQDTDGYVRRFTLTLPHLSMVNIRKTAQYPQFAVEIAGLYHGITPAQLLDQLRRHRFGSTIIPRSPDDWQWYQPGKTAWICYANRPMLSCPLLEYDQVLGADQDAASMARLASMVRGKIVLVGSTDKSEHDAFDTPLKEISDRSRPGVEIQANIIHTLLSGHYYSPFAERGRIALLFALALLTALLTLGLRPVRAIAPVLLLLFAIGWLDTALFNHRIVLRPCEILIAVILAYVFETIFQYFTEEARAKEARRHFGRYVGPKVLERVLDSGKVRLDGEVRHVAIMFTDVQGFTSLSENMTPADAVGVLNIYLTRMVDCIFKYDGTLDKIMGDGIMAYFGAPAVVPNPELQSVLCAIEMQQIMREWRQECERTGMPPLKKRIGIHSGEVIWGEVGSANQVGCTIIGDAVNVAARLEPLNKEYSTEILISDAVSQQLPDSIALKYEGEVPIRGRKEAVHAYSVQVPSTSVSNGAVQ